MIKQYILFLLLTVSFLLIFTNVAYADVMVGIVDGGSASLAIILLGVLGLVTFALIQMSRKP